MSLSFDDRIGLGLLRLAHALQTVSLALIRLGMVLGRVLDHAFNPNQPRVPAGRSDGGQWTDGDEAGVIPVADNGRPANDRYLNQHIMANHAGKSDVALVARIKGSQFRLFGDGRGSDRNESCAPTEAERNGNYLISTPGLQLKIALGLSNPGPYSYTKCSISGKEQGNDINHHPHCG